MLRYVFSLDFCLLYYHFFIIFASKKSCVYDNQRYR